MLRVKIKTTVEETKKLIHIVFPGLSFYDNGKSISFSVDQKHPDYLQILSKIPDLLTLDTLVEISNSKEDSQYVPLPGVESFLTECSEESKKQRSEKECKKRYFEPSIDELEEGEIRKPKVNLSHRNRYLRDRKIFIDIVILEVDKLVRSNQIEVGEKYDLFRSLSNRGSFNKDFRLFYSKSDRSRDFLTKLDISEFPMDIIDKIIYTRYKGDYASECSISDNGYIDAKIKRCK